jgi:transcriptional regulator with XRE-family HTH domain
MFTNLAPTLRVLRRKQRLSLREVADAAGITAGYLSLIERGAAVPSVVALGQIANALGVSLAQFFEDGRVENEAAQYVVRPHERRVMVYPDTDIRHELLVPDFRRRIEAIISKIKPGTQSPVYKHEGEDFGYVLKGCLQFWIEDDKHVLEEGTSISFPSRLRHYWIHPVDAEPAETLWAITPPTW